MVGTLQYRLPPLCECSRNPSVSVYHLVLLWEPAFSFSEFFWRFNTFAHFMMGDLWAHLPTLCWVLSSFWPKTAWPCAPLSLFTRSHPSNSLLFLWMKKGLKGKHFAGVEAVKQKMAETLEGLKIGKFKNCFDQWKKHLDRCIATNGNPLKVTEV